MTDPTKIHIMLVGPHSDAFMKALQVNESFNIEQCDSVPDHRTSCTDPTVLCLAGDSYTLSETAVDQALRSKTALALFKPSHAVLETIHKATHTPIDIPSLELVDELPLLIYMVDGVVHIAPNNGACESGFQDFVQQALAKDEDAPPLGSFTISPVTTDPAEECIRSMTRAALAMQSVAGFISNLVPPSGVIGFKRGTIDNSRHLSLTLLPWTAGGRYKVTTSDAKLIQKYDLNWYTDVYSYATGADCRGKTASQFTNAGGVVYTIAIERGNLQRAPSSPQRYLGPTSGYCSYYFVDWSRIGTHSLTSSMTMLGHQPSGEDSQSGTVHKYAIDFQQEMQMFDNNGNSKYTFKAQYSKDFSLNKFQQHDVLGSAGVDYSVSYKDHYDHWADPDFKTRTWFDPGVYQKVNRSGRNYWIVRENLPADNLPINGLTIFSSSVGKHTLFSKYRTSYRAFKSDEWRTANESDRAHFAYYYWMYWSTGPSGEGWTRALDLTWS